MQNHELEQEKTIDQEQKDVSAAKDEVSQNADQATKEIATLKDKVAKLEDQLLRAVAESENIKRRYERTIEESRTYAINNFAKDLLGVMDNLIRALEHKDHKNHEHMANVMAGVEMTKHELESVFRKHQLEPISPSLGDKFDYNLHYAVSQVMTDEYQPDEIIGIMQIGYKIRERLLRPAMVNVAKKPTEEASS